MANLADPAACWYVLHVKPNAERQVVRRLREQWFRPYLPFLTTRRLLHGKNSEAFVPLFPGYLFVELDVEQDERWKAIGNTKGVLTLLPTTERPFAVARREVEELRRCEKEGLFKIGSVRVGERVRVFRGSLADQVLECIGSNGERLRCLWSCLGAERVVEIPLAHVQVLR